MVNFIKAILFLYSICLLGFFINSSIYYLCEPRSCVEGRGEKKRRGRIKIYELPLFFLLGAGTYTFYETFFSILGIKSNVLHFVFLFVAFLLVFAVLYNKRGASESSQTFPGEHTRAQLLPVAIIVLAVLLPWFVGLFKTMSFPQFDIDMVGHILIKAKIFTTDTYKSSVFIHDDLFSNMHSRYPPFIGIFFNLLFLVGCSDVSCYQVVNYFIFLLVGITFYNYLREKIPLWQALSWFFIFMSTGGYIASQFIIDSTDVLLSLSFLLSLIWFLKFQKNQDMYSLVISAIIIGMSTLIKNEALFFSLIMIFIWLWGNKRGIVKYLLLWAFIAMPWILYRSTLPVTVSDSESFISIFRIMQNFKFFGYVFAQTFPTILQHWNSAFILFIPATVVLLKSKYKKEAGILFLIIAALVSVYFSMYLLQVGKTAFIRPGFFRILCHVYPMALISIALAIERLMSKENYQIKGG